MINLLNNQNNINLKDNNKLNHKNKKLKIQFMF